VHEAVAGWDLGKLIDYLIGKPYWQLEDPASELAFVVFQHEEARNGFK